MAAAEAGKHVLCEKPMALSVEDCERMNAAAEANGVRLGVAYYRRFYPAVARVAEISQVGRDRRARRRAGGRVRALRAEPDHPRRWLIERGRAGGGPMFDFGCHRVEVLLNLFGRAVEVKGLTSNVVFEREVEDAACALIKFEHGTQAVVTVTHASREPRDTLEIFGSEGSIRIDVLNEGRLVIKSARGEREELHPPHANLHQPLIEDFARAVVEGRRPRVDGAVGQAVSEVLELIYEG